MKVDVITAQFKIGCGLHVQYHSAFVFLLLYIYITFPYCDELISIGK